MQLCDAGGVSSVDPTPNPPDPPPPVAGVWGVCGVWVVLVLGEDSLVQEVPLLLMSLPPFNLRDCKMGDGR